MPREAAKASARTLATPIRARVELDDHALYLSAADGRWRGVPLTGARVFARDAACSQRFVRHLAVRLPDARIDLITPPERGTIAPRAARLPGVPKGSFVVDPTEWEIVSEWLRSGGGFRGRTIAELARLACVATSQFAIALGERIAHAAAELCWERMGPMRGGSEMIYLLRPLEEAAERSQRAHEALIAALSRGVVLRPYAFV